MSSATVCYICDVLRPDLEASGSIGHEPTLVHYTLQFRSGLLKTCLSKKVEQNDTKT